VEYYHQQDNRIFMEYIEPERPTCSMLVLAYKLAKAIHYLHSNNICHTDIKPKNIIVTSGNQIKLIDFGESMKMQLWKKGRTGTYGYMAPEMFDEGFWNGKEVDVWSFGVVCKDWRLHILADLCLKEKKDRPTIQEVLKHPIFSGFEEN
jgi:serine/threonine protein kinase